jgi:hypothetical protein
MKAEHSRVPDLLTWLQFANFPQSDSLAHRRLSVSWLSVASQRIANGSAQIATTEGKCLQTKKTR